MKEPRRKTASPKAIAATVKDDVLFVSLDDGRVLQVPLESFPRLQATTPQKLQNLRLIGHGQGIHWPDLDEDLSVRGLLLAAAADCV